MGDISADDFRPPDKRKPGAMEGHYFPVLTGLRAVAAFMVFFHHFNSFSGPLRFFINQWFTGVTLFFVLSGFLITHRYYNAERFHPGKYFVNRFARIYPLYFLLTTVTFVVLLYSHATISRADIKVILLNITLLKSYFDRYKASGITQGWSLTVEELFYFLAPIFFMLIRRSRHFLWMLPLLFLAAGFLMVRLFDFGAWDSFMASDAFMLLTTFFGRSTEFFVGIWLAIRLLENRPVFSIKGITWLATALILLCLYLLVLTDDGSYLIIRPAGIFIKTFVLPFCIIMLFQGLLTEKTILSRILSSRLFSVLGKSSYAFYLIHMGILAGIFVRTKSLILILILLQVSAIILWKLIEEPLNKGIRKLYRKYAGNTD